MSPTVNMVATDEGRQQQRADAGREEAGAMEKRKKSRKARGQQDKLLDLFMILDKRMDRIDASQEEKEYYKGHEASVFGSVVGQGKPMSTEALDMTTLRRVSPGASPSKYFSVHRRIYFEEATNEKMAKAPQPTALPLQFVPPSSYQPALPQQFVLGLQYSRMPKTRQQKLDIRPFDGKELYQGLVSGPYPGSEVCSPDTIRGKGMRLSWTEDVKIDILGYHLVEVAKRYYNRQVEGWQEEQPTFELAVDRKIRFGP